MARWRLGRVRGVLILEIVLRGEEEETQEEELLLSGGGVSGVKRMLTWLCIGRLHGQAVRAGGEEREQGSRRRRRGAAQEKGNIYIDIQSVVYINR